jgi:hypothetical protein
MGFGGGKDGKDGSSNVGFQEKMPVPGDVGLTAREVNL